MPRVTAMLLLLCACATTPPPPVPGRSETCQRDYDVCNNTCFASPHYKVNGPQCARTTFFQLCPQKDQLVDTVAATKCFDACEWNVKSCTAPPAPAVSEGAAVPKSEDVAPVESPAQL